VSKYNVSVNTLRQSLETLRRRGIIRKEQGRGSFVSLQSSSAGRTGTLRNIGLIFERSEEMRDQAFESEVILHFVNVCRKMQLRFTCVETDIDAHTGGLEMIKSIEGVDLDGVCVFLHTTYRAEERLAPLVREFAAPVALFPDYTNPYEVSMDSIALDNNVGLEQMMQYLLGLGHRRIAYVGEYADQCLVENDSQGMRGRWSVYSDALREAGIPVDPDLLVNVPYRRETQEGVIRRVVHLVRRDNPATAIVSFNDWTARQVIEWLWREGIRVPDDVSVTGLDNVQMARQLIPRLTTVGCPYTRVVEAAIELMHLRLADHSRAIQKVLIPSELYIGESVKAL
jgi:DNA-binding LacI/PurR family transcriptional regulator